MILNIICLTTEADLPVFVFDSRCSALRNFYDFNIAGKSSKRVPSGSILIKTN